LSHLIPILLAASGDTAINSRRGPQFMIQISVLHFFFSSTAVATLYKSV
jgi:hypothetical protein